MWSIYINLICELLGCRLWLSQPEHISSFYRYRKPNVWRGSNPISCLRDQCLNRSAKGPSLNGGWGFRWRSLAFFSTWDQNAYNWADGVTKLYQTRATPYACFIRGGINVANMMNESGSMDVQMCCFLRGIHGMAQPVILYHVMSLSVYGPVARLGKHWFIFFSMKPKLELLVDGTVVQYIWSLRQLWCRSVDKLR